MRVALLLGQDLGYTRRVLSGVLNYVEAHQLKWIFHNAAPDVRVLAALERWRPDGIIVHLSDCALGERLLELSVPIVSVTDTISGLEIPYVDVDSEAVGRTAADYFLGLGYRSFAYYGSRHVEFSRNREKGYRMHLEALGYSVSNLHADFLPHSPFSQDWSRMDRQTERWLSQLPKPVAILASNDIPARVLCDTCRNLGIRVPEDVSVLGVDNDVSECRMSLPALSSVELPAEQVGRDATGLLRQLIEGEEVEECRRTLRPSGIISRASTDYRATNHEEIKRALDFIEQYADRGISVPDVCHHSGLSRRSLERLFKDELSFTLLEQIQKVRMARAKRLLLESEFSIGAVAERAGFGNLRQFNRVFQRYEQESPSAYRARR